MNRRGDLSVARNEQKTFVSTGDRQVAPTSSRRQNQPPAGYKAPPCLPGGEEPTLPLGGAGGGWIVS
ncbi:hypothetical protein D0T84_19875 [Dysgonomonas sp. 521]|nr:hypothetical protein [Dysgonomonas sp. 521]